MRIIQPWFKLVGLNSWLVMVMTSHAGFVNITIENENAFFANHHNESVGTAWNALGGTLDVYRVYANFDTNSALDHVHSVFGSPALPSFLNSSDGAFWNYITTNPKTGEPEHWDWPVHPSLYTTIPQFAWDTFPTVGFGPFLNQGGGGGPGLNHFQTNWVNTEYSWHHGANFPSEGDAVPGGPSGFRVGLFQATVAAGVQVSGQFALDTGHGIFWGDHTAFTTIPAPGIPAALMAGALIFFHSRRRRH